MAFVGFYHLTRSSGVVGRPSLLTLYIDNLEVGSVAPRFPAMLSLLGARGRVCSHDPKCVLFVPQST
jgi:hypothetical protein